MISKVPSKVFYVAAGAAGEVAVLAACIHHPLCFFAAAGAFYAYGRAEELAQEEKNVE